MRDVRWEEGRRYTMYFTFTFVCNAGIFHSKRAHTVLLFMAIHSCFKKQNLFPHQKQLLTLTHICLKESTWLLPKFLQHQRNLCVEHTVMVGSTCVPVTVEQSSFLMEKSCSLTAWDESTDQWNSKSCFGRKLCHILWICLLYLAKLFD